MKLLIGSDPEFAVYSKALGHHISADGLIPGTKDKPHPVEKGAVQLDGTALEINVEAADSFDKFKGNTETVISKAKEFLPKNFELRIEAAVEYPEEYFNKLPESAKQMGCDLDYDAVTGRTNPVPRRMGTMSTFGGHWHLGWTEKQKVRDEAHAWDARQMTLHLHQYFSKFIPIWDPDTRRSSMYGRNAAYRVKPYGLEYRTPSNAWVKYPELWPWIYESIHFVFNHAVAQKTYARDHFSDMPYIHQGKLLGYTKGGALVYDTPGINRQWTLAKRLEKANQEVVQLFCEAGPEFPKTFEQVSAPQVQLAFDQYHNPI